MKLRVRLQKPTPAETLKLVIPAHRPIKRSTLSHILKQARLSVEELIELGKWPAERRADRAARRYFLKSLERKPPSPGAESCDDLPSEPAATSPVFPSRTGPAM